ncbi:MAG: DUF1810 domain-containing protein [Pseudomonadota bacterium]
MRRRSARRGFRAAISDPFNLSRFVEAQAPVYAQACAELSAGRKTTHWMWFIFPQIVGLGLSPMARFYAIASAAEARAYLADPLLGARLRHCTDLTLQIDGRSAHDIFGSPDDLKFRSSMTLFAAVASPPLVFDRALEKYFAGAGDPRTRDILRGAKS